MNDHIAERLRLAGALAASIQDVKDETGRRLLIESIKMMLDSVRPVVYPKSLYDCETGKIIPLKPEGGA